VHCCVAVEVISRAVKTIGPGLDSEIDGTAGAAATLWSSTGHEGELLNRIEWENDTGDT
jgi:hypothetical protein